MEGRRLRRKPRDSGHAQPQMELYRVSQGLSECPSLTAPECGLDGPVGQCAPPDLAARPDPVRSCTLRTAPRVRRRVPQTMGRTFEAMGAAAAAAVGWSASRAPTIFAPTEASTAPSVDGT